VVSFTPRPLYPRGKSSPCPLEGEPVWTTWRKFLILPGLELRPLRRTVRSQSLYRLHYLGSLAFELGSVNENMSSITHTHPTVRNSVDSVESDQAQNTDGTLLLQLAVRITDAFCSNVVCYRNPTHAHPPVIF
jgi:hypothetical protein